MKAFNTIHDMIQSVCSQTPDKVNALFQVYSPQLEATFTTTLFKLWHSPFGQVPIRSISFPDVDNVAMRFCLDDEHYCYTLENKAYIQDLKRETILKNIDLNDVCLKLWRFSFGYENPTIGIVWADSKEEAITKVKAAYSLTLASLDVRPFGVMDKTAHRDVLEVVDL